MMPRSTILVKIFLLLAICVWLAQGLGVAPVWAEQDRSGATVIPEPGGVQVEWVVAEPAITRSETGQVLVHLDGFDRPAQPGEWDLPSTVLLLALPSGAEPGLEVVAAEREPVDLPGEVRWVPPDAPGETIEVDQAEILFEEIGVMRGVRLARLVFNPIQPGQGSWWLTKRLAVRVNFNAPGAEPDESGALRVDSYPDPAVTGLASLVANPTQIEVEPLLDMESGLQSTIDLLPFANAQNFSAQGPGYVFQVSGSGLAQVSYEHLLAADPAVASLNPANLGIFQGGVQLAAEWSGDGDGLFEAGEGFIFFASPRSNRWVNGDMYAILDTGEAGLRIQTRPGEPGGLTPGVVTVSGLFEQNKIYTPDCYCGSLPLERDGDRWVWEALSQPGDPTAALAFTLLAPDPSLPAQLDVWMTGNTTAVESPDHRVEVSVNGTSLGSLEWDGRSNATDSFTIPAGVLAVGTNTLTLNLPGVAGVSAEGAWLDAFQVRYAAVGTGFPAAAVVEGQADPRAYTLSLSSLAGLRIYDVSDPLNPARLTGWTQASSQAAFGDDGAGGRTYAYAASAGLLAPLQVRRWKALQDAPVSAVDYLVVSHPDFLSALAPLTALREEQGLATRIEDVQAIYDAYSAGVPAPEAIRDYLAAAYATWPAHPQYVLLVGDGTADPRRYLAGTPPTYLPPFLADVDPWAGETAADNRFVTVDGSDGLPDMAIGRLPANSAIETAAVVQKIVQYETAPYLGSWERIVQQVTDDPDGAGNYPLLSGEIVSVISDPYSAPALGYTPPGDTPETFHAEVLEVLNGGSGALIYTGHASIHQWGAESFLHISNISGLANGQKLPFLLEMTCLTASFQVPGLSVIDEVFLRSPTGGAVAVWGSTGMGVSDGYEVLGRTLLDQVYNLGEERLGPAALTARLALAGALPNRQGMVDAYTLLGDPATRVGLRTGDRYPVFLPAVIR